VKFFDVDWNYGTRAAYPMATLRFKSPVPKGIEIVPTVYITSRVVRELDTSSWAAEELAHDIRHKLESMADSLPGASIHEIQFDCDWTPSTRDVYFKLLRAMSNTAAYGNYRYHWDLSATIRLHQIKYFRQTGVPPVSRGMLMAYNMGNVTDPGEENSIFRADEVLRYLGGLEAYPLPLDAALPLFSWGVVFHLGHFSELLNGVRAEELLRDSTFEAEEGSGFRVRNDTYFHGHHLLQGDMIRIEEVNTDECEKVARAIASRAGHDSMSVSLFHFDPSILKHYGRASIEDIYGAFD
jgi:hypothetical protein